MILKTEERTSPAPRRAQAPACLPPWRGVVGLSAKLHFSDCVLFAEKRSCEAAAASRTHLAVCCSGGDDGCAFIYDIVSLLSWLSVLSYLETVSASAVLYSYCMLLFSIFSTSSYCRRFRLQEALEPGPSDVSDVWRLEEVVEAMLERSANLGLVRLSALCPIAIA